VARIYDAQLGDRERGDATDVRRYVRLGPLGRAIVRAGYGRRSVVLIDEIDKADIDFPNDLLREIDQWSFEIPEVAGLRYAVPADRPDLRPIIIVSLAASGLSLGSSRVSSFSAPSSTPTAPRRSWAVMARKRGSGFWGTLRRLVLTRQLLA